MDERLIVILLSSLAELIFSIAGLLQLRKLIKKKDKSGLSSWSWIFSTASAVAWMRYGFSIELWPMVVATILWLPISVGVLQFLVKPSKRVQVLFVILVLSVTFTVLIEKSGQLAGWVGVGIGIVSVSPQIRRAIIDKKLSGISVGSFAVNVFGNGITLVYGTILGSAPLITSGVLFTVFNTFIAVQSHRKRM